MLNNMGKNFLDKDNHMYQELRLNFGMGNYVNLTATQKDFYRMRDSSNTYFTFVSCRETHPSKHCQVFEISITNIDRKNAFLFKNYIRFFYLFLRYSFFRYKINYNSIDVLYPPKLEAPSFFKIFEFFRIFSLESFQN